MNNDKLTVSYFSAGVSSAIATKMMIGEIDRIMYTHINDHHPDTLRFLHNCETWFCRQIEIWQSDRFSTVDECCRAVGFIKNRKGGAACTQRLKREVRKLFEMKHKDNMRIIWGLDSAEIERSRRIEDAMPNHEHVFPLIDADMTKKDAHRMLQAAGIKRPAMYDLGYHNNNCIGCLKGGIGYWNHIRVDFPDVFQQRAKMERLIGFPILGRDVWLDELDPDRGRHAEPICNDCGIFCEIMAEELMELSPNS
jgi:hypothetical protein